MSLNFQNNTLEYGKFRIKLTSLKLFFYTVHNYVKYSIESYYWNSKEIYFNFYPTDRDEK